MIDHITIAVKNLEKSKLFYIKALSPLGYQCINPESTDVVGFCINNIEGQRDFWIIKDENASTGSKYCIAFKAQNTEMVNRFYESAIDAGGSDNGKPGYRPKYHSGYYAAFVYDPDGYNIEAVFDDFK